MIPYQITDQTVTFFAKGRPWVISTSDSPVAFKNAITLLKTTPIDVEKLIKLSDPTHGLESLGLVLTNGAIYYGGKPLHNAWVDKILRFRSEGIPYDPVFNALKSLVKNPTPEAIERLPIFMERSQLGFLPDGRIAGFKAVKDDYYDIHTGRTYRYSVGSTIEQPRELCDADPNRTCSTGLHVGALDYVKEFGSGGSRIVLVAFWPEDVVAVPVDYSGGKIRICKLDVIDEVDRAFADAFLEQNKTVVGSTFTPEPAPQALWETAKVGDVIKFVDANSVSGHSFGTVIKIDPPHSTTTMHVEVHHHGHELGWWILDRNILEVIPENEAAGYKAKVGQWLTFDGEDDYTVTWYRIAKIDQVNHTIHYVEEADGQTISEAFMNSGVRIADKGIQNVVKIGDTIYLSESDCDQWEVLSIISDKTLSLKSSSGVPATVTITNYVRVEG